jgi:hypothetical protein
MEFLGILIWNKLMVSKLNFCALKRQNVLHHEDVIALSEEIWDGADMPYLKSEDTNDFS